MNTNLLAIIKRIVTEQGEGILGEPHRLKGFVKNYAANVPKEERVVFGRCIEAGCYSELKRAATPQERSMIKARFQQQLVKTGVNKNLCAASLDLLEAVIYGAAPPRRNITPKALRNALIATGALAAIIAVVMIAQHAPPSDSAGNVMYSLKDRVKSAGGNVDGSLRFSIQWNESGKNPNDFDAWCYLPDHTKIGFTSKTGNPSGGELDVDVIYPRRIAVENIAWPGVNKIPEGDFQFYVNCYSNRGGLDGFRAEIEFDGQAFRFDYPKAMRENDNVDVAIVNYSRERGFRMVKSLNN